MAKAPSHVYGPVPSRRLKRSLGVDLVPYKTCTYDCVYCQLGRTTNRTVRRREYVPVPAILAEIEEKLSRRPLPDYISLAGSGEPTLNTGLGDLIDGIKRLTRVPVAVLTNGSLLWKREVQDSLISADLVLPSLDAGDEGLFQCVNRPHRSLAFARTAEGIAEFTARFPGKVWLEVFLLAGLTAWDREVEKIARWAKKIRPERVQLNTVSRPPAEDFAFAVSREELERLARRFPGRAEVINENPRIAGGARKADGAADREILSLLNRRPCTVRGVALGLGLNAAQASKRLEALCRKGLVGIVRRDRDLFFDAMRAQ